MKQMKNNRFIMNLLIISLFNSMPLLVYPSASEFGHTDKTLEIEGSPPFMASIGTIVKDDDFYHYDKNDVFVTTPDMFVMIPSIFCNDSMMADTPLGSKQTINKEYFNFVDLDFDQCDSSKIQFVEWLMMVKK